MGIEQAKMVKAGAQRVLDSKPERLFAVGLRCTIEGFDYSDIECWETAWQTYCREVDAVCARRLLGEVQYFVRVLRKYEPRSHSLFPYGCRRLSHDESQILNFIVCLQKNDAAAAAVAVRLVLGNAAQCHPENLKHLLSAGQAVADAFTAHALFFIPLGQDVLDALTGRSNAICPACPSVEMLQFPKLN